MEFWNNIVKVGFTIEEPPKLCGGAATKENICGKLRRIYKDGRKHYVIIKGEKIALKVARKMHTAYLAAKEKVKRKKRA